MTEVSIVYLVGAVVLLVINGLVGLGVEGSKRTEIAGVFAAGWLTFMEGMGFFALWCVEWSTHSLALGIGFVAIGLGIVSMPFVHRELQRGSADR